MSFEDSGDPPSFAAIAESTLENEDAAEPEAADKPSEQAAEELITVPSEPDEPATEEHADTPTMVHMEDRTVLSQTLSDEVAVTSDVTQASDQAEESQVTEEAKPEAITSVVSQGLEVTTSEVSQEVTTSKEQLQSDEQQSTYANLQPIFLAMEMGQEAVQAAQSEEQHQSVTTATEIAQQPQVIHITQAGQEQANANQLIFSQQIQGATMILNNLTTTLTEGGTQVSLQSILQDVVSGIQTSAGTVPAAIITDPSSSTGSFLIVNQNGIPIVRPVLVSNMPESAGTGAEMLQVLAAGIHGMEEGATGEGEQETVEVTADADGEASSAAAGLSSVDEESSMDLTSVTEGMSVRVQVHHDASGDEESTPSRTASGKRKLSDGPRICEQCNKAFKYPSDLKKHLQIHTNVKKFKCDDCGRFFRRLHQLNVHTRIHTGEKPYVCNRCGISFRHDSTLTMHIRTRHDHLRPFKCDECGNTFGRLSHLRKHVRKVCGNRRNKDRPIAQCRFCDENFPTKGDLRKHVISCEKKEAKVKAKEVTLHVCDQCSKDFASPYNLRRHQLTHTDDKPFQCDVCARQFKEKSSLSKHMKRKHTGVDQGSQTDETGETEYNNVDVIAESAAASGVTMDTEETVETGMGGTTDEGTSTINTSHLVSTEGVRVQGTQVMQSDIEMTTIELSLSSGAESHEATALQAAVEALVSASQQQIAVEQESMEITTEEPPTGKEMFEGVKAEGDTPDVTLVGSTAEYSEVKEEPSHLTDPSLVTEDSAVEYVQTNGDSPQEQVATESQTD